MNIDKIPESILEDLRERLSDADIKGGNAKLLFMEYCEWHGLRLWGARLIKVLDTLRACEDEQQAL